MKRRSGATEHFILHFLRTLDDLQSGALEDAMIRLALSRWLRCRAGVATRYEWWEWELWGTWCASRPRSDSRRAPNGTMTTALALFCSRILVPDDVPVKSARQRSSLQGDRNVLEKYPFCASLSQKVVLSETRSVPVNRGGGVDIPRGPPNGDPPLRQ